MVKLHQLRVCGKTKPFGIIPNKDPVFVRIS